MCMRENILLINCSPVRNGATAEILRRIGEGLSQRMPQAEIRSVCIADYDIAYCLGCRQCHNTGVCVQQDGAEELMAQFEWAGVIIPAAPSYWAELPGQFKVFIDRCTPWSNTHEPHARLSGEKRGYAVSLRTGPGMAECERLIASLEHFFGHLEIRPCGSMGLCGVSCRADVAARAEEIRRFCETIL